MSILRFFGENLRLLAVERGSLSAAAEELGFSKTQFHRYLSGASFPKPQQLKRICDYFDVDARILTEPITDELMASMRQHTAQMPLLRDPAQLEAMNFACSTQDYFSGDGGLKDGFYVIYRHSMAIKGKYLRVLIFIKTLNKARVVRGYDTKLIYPEGILPPAREFRGIVYRTADGHAIVFYHNPPLQAISLMFMAPIANVIGVPTYTGFSFLARASLPNRNRYSAVVVERLPGGVPEAIRLARKDTFIAREELPIGAQILLTGQMG